MCFWIIHISTAGMKASVDFIGASRPIYWKTFQLLPSRLWCMKMLSNYSKLPRSRHSYSLNRGVCACSDTSEFQVMSIIFIQTKPIFHSFSIVYHKCVAVEVVTNLVVENFVLAFCGEEIYILFLPKEIFLCYNPAWKEEDISLECQVVSRNDTFRYLGSML